MLVGLEFTGPPYVPKKCCLPVGLESYQELQTILIVYTLKCSKTIQNKTPSHFLITRSGKFNFLTLNRKADSLIKS